MESFKYRVYMMQNANTITSECITEILNTNLDNDTKYGSFLSAAATIASILGIPQDDFIDMCKATALSYQGPLPDEVAEYLMEAE